MHTCVCLFYIEDTGLSEDVELGFPVPRSWSRGWVLLSSVANWPNGPTIPTFILIWGSTALPFAPVFLHYNSDNHPLILMHLFNLTSFITILFSTLQKNLPPFPLLPRSCTTCYPVFILLVHFRWP